MMMRDLSGRWRLSGRLSVSALLVLLAAGMSGCVLFLGGAALGGAIVATDRRSVGIQVEDTEIEHRVNQALEEHFARQSVRIDVTSYNQKVLLAGQVPSDQDRDYAERLAAVQQNVQTVHNELTIGSLAGLSSQTDDGLLRGKVASALLDVPGLSSGVVKTTCTDGTIFLLGRVSAAEAALAERAASHVNGVKRVVALFDVLSDAEMEPYKPKAPASAGQAAGAPAPKAP
jgi:osmotically-inducible protein OsmY